jgi:cytochrome c-type biogenesis protein CcmH
MLSELKKMIHHQDTKGTKGAVRAGALVSLVSWWFIAFAPAALAITVDPQLADPAMEARAREIGRELRCLVCQNQSIEDSNATLARDLRLIVRERIAAGDSDTQVKTYVTTRYGDWVLLKPPFNIRTLLLWLGPALLLAVAAASVLVWYRRTRTAADPMLVTPLSSAEEQRLGEILNDERRA